MSVLLIFLAGVLDRIRGCEFDILQNRLFDKLTYGWIIAVLLGHIGDMLTLPVAALFAVGMSIALSEPIGAGLDGRTPDKSHLEWYMVGPFAHYVWPALILRGAMTGVPMLVLYPWLDSAWVVSAAYTMAFPLPVLVARYMPEFAFPRPFPERWACQEYLRGWIGAALIIGIKFNW